jgi:hypothetical protein
LVGARFRCSLIRSTLPVRFEMASLGHGHYVVLVIHVGGTKLSDVKQVLQREPRTGTVHCGTLYRYSLLIPIRAFPSDGRTNVGTSLLQYS